MLICPRVHFKEFMLKGAQIGSKEDANPCGWSSERLFMEFLDHFIEHAKPSKEEPVLLFLDNHERHINVPVIKKAHDTGIIMITFPRHTSHKLRPLDRTVFGSFKLHFNRAVNDWMSSNRGKTLSLHEVSHMVGRTFPLAFRNSNTVSGFATSGISAPNEDIFPDDSFLSSYALDRPEPAAVTQKDSFTSEVHAAGSAPSSSHKNEATVSPDMIRPFPKVQSRIPTSKSRKKGKSRILTDTPNKEEIELMNQSRC
jgi:hypothetical protein